jgi:hypothetical protein
MNTSTISRLRRIGLAIGITVAIVLATAAGLGMLASAAPAATPIYVRTDGSDANCNGTVNVAYSAGVAPSCAAAIHQGDTLLHGGGGTVMVGAGTYVENVTIGKDLTLQGAGAGSTIVDGGASSRVIYVSVNADVTITGVTIRNGAGFAGAGLYVASHNVLTLTNSTVSGNTSCNGCSGAGLYMESDVPAVISGCTFANNTTGNNADAGAIRSWNSKLAITGSTFTGNEAAGRGGAINHGGISGSLLIVDSVFSNNTVSGTAPAGGAIWHDSSTMVISNTTILNNSTNGDGGAIALSGGRASIYGSLIANNSAVDSDSCYGGAIYNFGSLLLIEDSVLRGNWVSGTGSTGGAIFGDGPVTLNRSTVSGNSASYTSGGIHSQESLTMTNVTISGNSATNTGGGFLHTGSAVGNVVNCTIVDNALTGGSPYGGGGIQVYGTVNMTNTLLADNDLANCGIIGSGASLNSGGHNLEDGNSCNLGATGDLINTDPAITWLSAMAPPVGAPGSQERMSLHALGRSSPAIDNGDDTACPPTDQRGVSRPVDGDGDSTATCDIGTFEFDLLNPVFLPLTMRAY